MPPVESVLDYTVRTREVLQLFNETSDVTVVSSKDIFCDDTACSSVSGNGQILFSDTNHASEHGARVLAAELIGYLSEREGL